MSQAMVRSGKPLRLKLRKHLTRNIKRGHAWVFSDAIDCKQAAPGSVAIVEDRQGRELASGIYHPQHAIPLRICRTEKPWTLDDAWLTTRLTTASQIRASAFDEHTTGYRLVNGEGDGMPGLVIDCYASTAVIKLDGGAPEAFYQPAGIASWLQQRLGIHTVVLRTRQRGRRGQPLAGDLPQQPIQFLENGLLLTADVVHGQKTGFFLDQRDHRHTIRRLAAGKTVLNLFSFNGGFSISAGKGGAVQVTSVDIAQPAVESAARHWMLNRLPPEDHQGVTADCFEYLQQAVASRRTWGVVICDPPSFAPNEQARPQALQAYQRLAELSARVTASGGFLALASCSSHVDSAAFTEVNAQGIAKAKRKAFLLNNGGLPIDHPTPLAMPELRYLKFQLYRLQ